MRFAIPLAGFCVLTVMLTLGLRVDPRRLPSPLIGRTAPSFRLAELHAPDRTFSPNQMRGRVWMLNVWASWCVSCRVEHPLLTALADAKVVPVYGLDYRDERDAALAFLETHGDPYELSIQDPDGRTGIDYGVYGVPETYLIDKAGVIRFKHVGPVTGDVVERTILPLVEQLNR